MLDVSPLDALTSVKMGTFREFQLDGLVTNLALGVTPLLKRQTSRRHLIFGPAIGTFEDDHRFTAQKDPVPGIAADRVFLLGKSIIKESPEYP